MIVSKGFYRILAVLKILTGGCLSPKIALRLYGFRGLKSKNILWKIVLFLLKYSKN